MDDKVKVCLYGISGVYNYGCEAMIRAISKSIKNEYPLAEVIYKTYDYEYDKNQLNDCDTVSVSELKVHVKETSIKHKLTRIKKYIKKKIGIANEEDRLPYDTKWLKECDYLVIIGGDVFDLMPGQVRHYDNERIWASIIAKKNKAKVILWGISVGNFESNNDAKKTIINYFNSIVDTAIIRDEKSLEYLKQNGITNAYLGADPAFMIRTLQTSANTNTKVLGINLSPLANRYLKDKYTEVEWINVWCEKIYTIYKKYNYKKIILLPHVVNKNKLNDDDYSYLEKIGKLLYNKGVDVELVPRNVGFIGIKKYLVQCNLVMSARMHCSLNSITCGVPTVFLSYSPKSVGMCEFVYGNSKLAIDMNDLISDIDINLLDKIDDETYKIREFLSVRNIELCDMARKSIQYFDLKGR